MPSVHVLTVSFAYLLRERRGLPSLPQIPAWNREQYIQITTSYVNEDVGVLDDLSEEEALKDDADVGEPEE